MRRALVWVVALFLGSFVGSAVSQLEPASTGWHEAAAYLRAVLTRRGDPWSRFASHT